MQPFQFIEIGIPATPEKKSWMPPVIGVAHAQQAQVQLAQDAPLRFGIHVEEPKFAVILKQEKSGEDAIRSAQQIRQKLPQAQAVESGEEYFVILGGAARNETDALIDASWAKKLLDGSKYQPRLVEIRK